MAKRDERWSPLTAGLVAHHYGWALSVAAHGVTPVVRALPPGPLDDLQWRDLLQGVNHQRLWGLLSAAVAEGALPCTGQQANEARVGAERAAMADLAIEGRLVETSLLLHGADIDHRLLKGITTAARVYPRRSLRSYGDVDVLVTGGSFDAAVESLEQAGGRRRFAQARPGFDHRFSKGTSFWMPDGISVDLHRTFVLGPYGFTVDLAGIFSRSDLVMVGGREIPCMDMLDAALHACMHAALGDCPPRLVSLRDVVQFVSDERVDATALLERSREWRCEAVLARAVALAEVAYGLPESPLTRWSAGYRSKRWEQRAIALYGEGHTYRRQAIGATRFVAGSRAKLAYIGALAFPAPTYLGQREGSVLRRALRAVSGLDVKRDLPRAGRVQAYLRSRWDSTRR